jgi:hypothetical protein
MKYKNECNYVASYVIINSDSKYYNDSFLASWLYHASCVDFIHQFKRDVEIKP